MPLISETTQEMGKEKPEVLAIIPARGGSRGIPRKNIVDLCGKPLIAYTIDVALKSTAITRVVVSTEDEEIAEISKRYGAEVPFLRPKELAEDRSNIADAICYTVNRLRTSGFAPDILIELYPTHLFRSPQLLDTLTSKLFEGYQTVKTVRRVDLKDMSFFSLNGENRILPLLTENAIGPDRVKQVYFRPYGMFIGSCQTRLQPLGTYLHHLADPMGLIDIDSYADLRLAEEIIKQGLFSFGLE
jgi:CMP-N-acetylneuraminic acid synthetase